MSSPDSGSSSLKVTASNKVLVPGSQGEGSLSLTDQLENPETGLEDNLVCEYMARCTIKAYYVRTSTLMAAEFLKLVVLMSYTCCRNNERLVFYFV